MASRDWNNDGKNNVHDSAFEHHVMDSSSGRSSSGAGGSGCSWLLWGILAGMFERMHWYVPALICFGVCLYMFFHS